MSDAPPTPSRRLRVALTALLILGSALFIWRGPYRAISYFNNDFLLVYSAGRAWMHGTSPYDREPVRQAWFTSGGPEERDPMDWRGPPELVYPPSTFAILSPIIALPWPIASCVWALLNAAMAAATFFIIARLGELTGTARLAFFAVGSCLYPLLANAGLGQMAGASVFLISAGCLAQAKRRHLLAGLLIGLGTAVKPQLGALFIVYQFGRWRWTVGAAAIVTVAIAMLIGGGRLSLAGIDWLASWTRNLQLFETVSDSTPLRTNEIRHQMVYLRYPLHNFTDNLALVRWITFAIAGILSGLYFLADLKRGREKGEPPGELLSLSMVAVICFIIVYHRLYDGGVFLFPLALAVRGIAAGKRRHWVTLALVLLYSQPFPVFLFEASTRGWLPAWIVNSPLGQNLILPFQAWMLVPFAMWLVWLRWDSREDLTQKST